MYYINIIRMLLSLCFELEQLDNVYITDITISLYCELSKYFCTRREIL